MNQDELASPRLSIVVTVTEAWPFAKRCLDALAPQLLANDAELIVVDGHGHGLPDPIPGHYGSVHWLAKPGAASLELRALATPVARGELVAFTEDHCVPYPNWCEEILSTADAHPQAGAVGGAIVNGSPNKISDWANYVMCFFPAIPPFIDEQLHISPPGAHLAFRRSVLTPGVGGMDGALLPPIGWLEQDLTTRLFEEGRFVRNEQIAVSHFQSFGLLGTFASHYHNGRAYTGLTTRAKTRRARLGMIRARVAAPFELTRMAAGLLRGKPTIDHRAKRSIPLVAALATAHALGEVAGLVAGPGGSVERLK